MCEWFQLPTSSNRWMGWRPGRLTMRGSARPEHFGVQVELLTDELKELAGWGVEPNRLARKPVLSKLAGIEPSLRPYTAGCIIQRYLVEAIEALPEGFYEYDGRGYTASTMKAGFYLELRIGTTRSEEHTSE